VAWAPPVRDGRTGPLRARNCAVASGSARRTDTDVPGPCTSDVACKQLSVVPPEAIACKKEMDTLALS
jgi:hypothetical protein